jgi:hypothetical protein
MSSGRRSRTPRERPHAAIARTRSAAGPPRMAAASPSTPRTSTEEISRAPRSSRSSMWAALRAGRPFDSAGQTLTLRQWSVASIPITHRSRLPRRSTVPYPRTPRGGCHRSTVTAGDQPRF